MNIHERGNRLKIRIQAPQGMLSVEQLYDLKTTELDTMAVALEKEYKTSGGKSFLTPTSSKDKIIKLKFDLVLDVLTTLVEEEDTAATALADKEHNQKIYGLMAKQEDKALSKLSKKELLNQLR